MPDNTEMFCSICGGLVFCVFFVGGGEASRKSYWEAGQGRGKKREEKKDR